MALKNRQIIESVLKAFLIRANPTDAQPLYAEEVIDLSLGILEMLEMSQKEQQFLRAVQSIVMAELLANGKLEMDAFVAMALMASERISETMRVIDAVDEFCSFMIDSRRDADDNCPVWFSD